MAAHLQAAMAAAELLTTERMAFRERMDLAAAAVREAETVAERAAMVATALL